MLCAIWSLRVFFTFFKLHKWYQIKQRTTIDGLTNWWIHFPLSTVYFLEKTVWFSSFLFTTKLLLVKLLFECLQIARWFVVIGLFIVNRQNKHLLMRHILQRVFTLFSYSASTNFFFEHLFLRPFYLLTRFLSLSALETSVIFFSISGCFFTVNGYVPDASHTKIYGTIFMWNSFSVFNEIGPILVTPFFGNEL